MIKKKRNGIFFYLCVYITLPVSNDKAVKKTAAWKKKRQHGF